MNSPAHLTLGDVLDLQPFRRAAPVLFGPPEQLRRPVRWVHSTELLDLGELVRPGDLVLTMGTGMPADDDTAGLDAYAHTLAEIGCAGVVVELGRRWRGALPDSVTATFRNHQMPLVALQHETRFAALAQAVGERLVETQLADLREVQRVHQTFTELSFAQAGPAEILATVHRLAGGSVVLEDAHHCPLDFVGNPDDVGFLDDWQRRSSRTALTGRTGWDCANEWLVTRIGSSDQWRGRLVIGCPGPPQQRLFAVAERAAAALASHWMHIRDRTASARRLHRGLFEALLSNPYADDVLRRCQQARFPMDGRHFLGVVVRPSAGSPQSPQEGDLVTYAIRAAHLASIPALVCEVGLEVRILLSLPSTAVPAAVAEAFARRFRSQSDRTFVIAAGHPSVNRNGIERTLLEAAHVARATHDSGRTRTPTTTVQWLGDQHLRGLLSLFGEDDRLRLYVDRELSPLRHNGPRGRDRDELCVTLKALLSHSRSKAEAAASLNLSRSAFYKRLAKVEQILNVDLDDPDVRVSLHVALLADELLASRRRAQVCAPW